MVKVYYKIYEWVGIPVLAYSPDRDKIARAHSSSALLEDGRIFYPSGKKWAKNLIDICSAFPAGDNDDIVDTCTQGLAKIEKRLVYHTFY